MPDPVDELYTLPLGEFIAARDRLAAGLAAAGRRDRAREVRALRRPTVAAWVVNQLAHRHGAALRRLIDAGDGLGRAQRRMLRGGDADALRVAAKRRQDALRELRGLAGPVLRDAGSAGHLDDVLATLEAASVDAAAARIVTAGRLAKELPRPSGFGDAPQLTQLASQTRRRQPRVSDTARARGHARERVAEAKRLAQAATRGERVAAQAARRVAALSRSRSDHAKRVTQLRAALEEAERDLREAEQEETRARADERRAAMRAGELRERAQSVRESTDDEP
jgi:hypothetical protein